MQKKTKRQKPKMDNLEELVRRIVNSVNTVNVTRIRPAESNPDCTSGAPTEQSQTLGSPIIDGIFLVQKRCIHSCVMIISTVLITCSPVKWRGQLVTHYVYIMYIYLPNKDSAGLVLVAFMVLTELTILLTSSSKLSIVLVRTTNKLFRDCITACHGSITENFHVYILFAPIFRSSETRR